MSPGPHHPPARAWAVAVLLAAIAVCVVITAVSR